MNDNKLHSVGIQETKRESFNDSYVNRGFIWQVLPANGTAGGILVGLNEKKFEVTTWKNGSFSVAGIIKNCQIILQ